uniref:SGTA homodimerisation domain-containing protein n=1 Tax=Knipowitschia caucasica TaxID=637954 RepID=A0AAV2KUL0_KNICA
MVLARSVSFFLFLWVFVENSRRQRVSSSPLPPHRALHPGIMSDTKRLAFSILRFLHDQLNSGTLTSDAKESLEVAVQCMETAYEISTDDQSLAVPMSLPEIFNAATAKFPAQSQANNNSSPNCLSDEDRAEAEALKTEGNEQMRVENYSAAVEFYSQAIVLNPQNAVYFCNR